MLIIKGKIAVLLLLSQEILHTLEKSNWGYLATKLPKAAGNIREYGDLHVIFLAIFIAMAQISALKMEGYLVVVNFFFAFFFCQFLFASFKQRLTSPLEEIVELRIHLTQKPFFCEKIYLQILKTVALKTLVNTCTSVREVDRS